jgi:hypothetical protein
MPKITIDRDDSFVPTQKQMQDIDANFSEVYAVNPSGGQDYYVDGNISTSGDGLSWATAFSTLAAAIAASNISIALAANRWWARRNRIFVVGDRLTEDLDTWPTKCDVIGRGSLDGVAGKAGIKGNHVPTGESYGTRWINIEFEPAASEDLIIIDGDAAGIEFHDCNFIGSFGAFTAPSAIDTTASEMMRIVNCNFMGAFSANYIDIGDGEVAGMRIINNTMLGSAVNGIMVTGTATVVDFASIGIIAGNRIYCPGITISDGNDDAFVIMDNTLVSDAATGTASLNIDTRWSAHNWITDATTSGVVDTVAAAILEDTGTTLPATLATAAAVDLLAPSVVASATATALTNAATIFTIAGGPIVIDYLVSICIATGDGGAATLQYSADPTVGAAATISGATGSLATAVAGSMVSFVGTALATAPTFLATGHGVIATGPSRIAVNAGVITTTVGGSASTATWKHYMRYSPMSSGVTVTVP